MQAIGYYYQQPKKLFCGCFKIAFRSHTILVCNSHFYDPILKLSVSSCRPGFLPDPNDGSLYVLGGKRKEGLMVSVIGRGACVFVRELQLSHFYESSLQKLPFTIPELVQSSPCRSSDGVLYTGNVKHICVFVMLLVKSVFEICISGFPWTFCF